MMDSANPHTERLPFCNLVYWKDNVACGKNDEWTRCNVEAFGQFPRVEFERQQRGRMADLLGLLHKAYQCGRADKSREIRKALGVEP